MRVLVTGGAGLHRLVVALALAARHEGWHIVASTTSTGAAQS